jgi:Co/Zn/Cd efflux system component
VKACCEIRTDVPANAGVLLAALGVLMTGAAWPDIVVGVLIAFLFGSSAIDVMRRARRQLGELVPS